MNPYERRIIHSALSDNPDVKTVSEGKEPMRYIAVIPNNAKPYDKGLRYGERRPAGKGARQGGKPFGDSPRGGKNFSRDNRGPRPAGNGGAKRGKKEIHFGTFLGNSGAKEEE